MIENLAMKKISLIYYIVVVSWLFLISIASFFFPYIIDSLPFFKIKTLEIEGLHHIPSHIVSTTIIERSKNNVIFLYTQKHSIIKKLNDLSGDAIKELQIRTTFSLDGSNVKILVNERKVFLSVVIEGKIYFFDEEGYKFNSKYYQTSYPIVYTDNLSLVENFFDKVKGLIDVLQAHGYKPITVYLTDINTILYTDNELRIVTPPIFIVDSNLISKVNRIINNSILTNIKHIEFVSEDVVIIR